MSKKISYFSQLDFLRAIAVTMTLLVHYYQVRYMDLGVDLFFALSGFLITSILLKTRELNSNDSKFSIIKNFIVRRALRLFPIYYLILFLFLVLSATTTIFWVWNKDTIIYYFTYTANLLFYQQGYQSGYLNHLWSLCVEEQFYLVWPWLILFVPFRYMKYALISVVVFGLLCWGITYNHNPHMHEMLTINNFHELGIGAFLAYLWYYQFDSRYMIHFKENAKKYFFVSLGLFILCLFCMHNFNEYSDQMWLYTLVREVILLVVFFFLLLSTIMGWNGYTAVIASNKSLQYVGKISYGIYLYHKPIPILLVVIFKKSDISMGSFSIGIISTVITLVIATLSYKYIEIPFLKMKEKFDN